MKTQRGTDVQKELADTIVSRHGPVEKIMLFDSRVRGDADEWSDADLIVIKKTGEPFVERLGEMTSLPVHADVFVYTPEEFERMKESKNPFIESALENSIILYERT